MIYYSEDGKYLIWINLYLRMWNHPSGQSCQQAWKEKKNLFLFNRNLMCCFLNQMMLFTPHAKKKKNFSCSFPHIKLTPFIFLQVLLTLILLPA